MKVGIMLFSRTGNTLALVEKAAEALRKNEHEVVLSRIHAQDESPNAPLPVRLSETPSMEGYDMLVLGSPVQGFCLTPIMKAYLAQAGSLRNRKVCCVMTQQFPHPWMGGNSAMKQFRAACEETGAQIVLTGIVNWSSKRRDSQMQDIAKRVADAAGQA